MLGERLDSWLRGHEPLVDVLVASVLAAGCVLLGVAVHADAAYFLFSLLLLLPLVLRRRHVVLCGALVLCAAFAQWLAVRNSNGALPADVAVPLAVHAVVAYGPPWAGRVGLATGLVGAVLGGLSWPQLPAPAVLHVVVGVCLASTVVAAWAVGSLQRVRRVEAGALVERAKLLEVERDQRARLAVLAERTRIAREMHDIVAHSLAVMIAQADGGRYAVVASPEAGRVALATIGDCARQALGDIRRVLGVLRDAPDDPGNPAPPQPGLDDVPGLVERVRAGGLEVRLAMEQPPGPVEPGLSLVVYRIVQEGLTNVVKHAGPTARAEVSVRWSADQLRIDVVDDGMKAGMAGGRSEPVEPGGGYGLVGMRERAGAFGGTVTLQARRGGGHALNARIPARS